MNILYQTKTNTSKFRYKFWLHHFDEGFDEFSEDDNKLYYVICEV